MTEENFRGIEVSEIHILENLSQHLISFGIIQKNTAVTAIKESDLKELAVKWKLRTVDSKTKKSLKREQVLKILHNHVEQSQSSRRDGRKSNRQDDYTDKNKIQPLKENYFGLPPWALQRTTEGIIYQGRTQ